LSNLLLLLRLTINKHSQIKKKESKKLIEIKSTPGFWLTSSMKWVRLALEAFEPSDGLHSRSLIGPFKCWHMPALAGCCMSRVTTGIPCEVVPIMRHLRPTKTLSVATVCDCWTVRIPEGTGHFCLNAWTARQTHSSGTVRINKSRDQISK